jgi:hypothetical protein
MQALIVRPFGTKEGVNFDRIQDELIAESSHNGVLLSIRRTRLAFSRRGPRNFGTLHAGRHAQCRLDRMRS